MNTSVKHPPQTLSTSSDQFQAISVIVTGITPGSNFDLELSPKTSGQTIQFTTGQETSRATGINMSAAAGATIPINNFSITPQAINVLTASGSGGGTSVSFTLNLSLYASADLSAFYLSSNSVRSGVSVNVSLGGGASQPVGDVPTAFFWSPN